MRISDWSSDVCPSDLAGIPALDPNFLLQVPAPDAPFIQGIGDAAPSELSSQIRQTVALETSTPASTDPAAVAPIATMLKPADPVPTPAAKPDAAGRDAETAVPKPEPATDLTPQSPAERKRLREGKSGTVRVDPGGP